MNAIETYLPGDFCWTELFTLDPTAVKSFYSGVFGWTFREVSVNRDPYTLCLVGTRYVAAMRHLVRESSDGPTTPFWRSYVAVEDCDDATARAERLGAGVLSPPSELGDFARTSVLTDPTGARFALWEPRAYAGSARGGEPGVVCWNELATVDVASARRFYASLFGWSCCAGRLGARQYLQFALGGTQIATMVALSLRAAHVAPLWLVYFAVANCNIAASRVTEHGGRITVPPIDVPGVGRFCAARDPAGAMLALIQLSSP